MMMNNRHVGDVAHNSASRRFSVERALRARYAGTKKMKRWNRTLLSLALAVQLGCVIAVYLFNNPYTIRDAEWAWHRSTRVGKFEVIPPDGTIMSPVVILGPKQYNIRNAVLLLGLFAATDFLIYHRQRRVAGAGNRR